MPVGIRLSLNFQETEIMTKDNYVYDYSEQGGVPPDPMDNGADALSNLG